ncbi:MAG: hypothetical protein VKP62_11940 [Candidatus Sericytochromatia bacterium]|nr:hypothetical protein [Candidatus Sericytochromatia bacterium]
MSSFKLETRQALVTLALSLGFVSCAPAPTTTPPTAPAPTPSELSAAPPPLAASPSSSGMASPSLSPAPTQTTRVRVQGYVTRQGQRVAGAALSAYDLATGQSLPLRHGETPAHDAVATGSLRADAEGNFDLLLTPLRPEGVVKLVARAEDHTWVALLASPSSPADRGLNRYRLRQAATPAPPLQLVLSPASTAAAMAFDGLLKLRLAGPPPLGAAGLTALLGLVEQAQREIDQALARRAPLAPALLTGLSDQGELTDPQPLRAALAQLGSFDGLSRRLRDELARLSEAPIALATGLAPITAADFPLDPPDIDADGTLRFGLLPRAIALQGPAGAWVPTLRSGGSRASTPRPTRPSRFQLVDMNRAATSPPEVSRWYAEAYDNRYMLLAYSTELRVFDTWTGTLRATPVATSDVGNGFYGVTREPGSSAVLLADVTTLQRGSPVDADLNAFTWQPYATPGMVIGGMRRFGADLYLATQRGAGSVTPWPPNLVRLTAGPATQAVVVGPASSERLPGASNTYDLALDTRPGQSGLWVLAQVNQGLQSIWRVETANVPTSTILLANIPNGRSMFYDRERHRLYLTFGQLGASTTVWAIDPDSGATSELSWDNGPAVRPVGGLALSPDGDVLYGFMR